MALTQDVVSYKRDKLLRRMCILTVITLITSIVSIIVGIIQISESGGKFPYSAGGAIIGGVMSFLLTLCPCCMYKEGKGSYDTTECFDCCTITMVIWWSLTVLAIPIGLGISGAYGWAECLNPPKDGVCYDNAGPKLALSVVTIIVSIILMVLTMGIFFTCCCNAKTFGQALLMEPSVRYIPDHNRYRQEVSAGFDPLAGFMRSGTGVSQWGGHDIQRSPLDRRIRDTDDEDHIQSLSVRLPPLDHGNRELSAPSPYSNNGRRYDREDQNTGAERIGTARSHPTSEDSGVSPSYSDPPPSYDEAVKLQNIGTIV